MATRSYIKTSDPINAADLAAKIFSDVGKTVTVEVTETAVLVTGTITASDDTSIQNSINGYYYAYTQIGTPVVDNPNTSGDRHDAAITEHAAYQADLAVLAAAQRKAWVSGVLKQNSFVYYTKATTVSGVATFWLTDDGTSTGNAVFTNVYADSITVSPYGTSALYQIAAPTVSADRKKITVNVNQVTAVLAGLLQSVTAANGVQCNCLVLGD